MNSVTTEINKLIAQHLSKFKNSDLLSKVFKVKSDGVEVINTTTDNGLRNIAIQPTAPVTPKQNDIWIDTSESVAPAVSTSTGKKGQIAGDSSYFYYCYADNLWIRVAKDGTWV